MPDENPPLGSQAQGSPSASGALLRRGVGLAVMAGSLLPLHRLLAPERTGPAGVQTRAAAEAAWASGLLGAAMVLVCALLLARLVSGEVIEARVRAAAERLARLRLLPFALGVGALAFLQGVLIAWAVHGGEPTSVDEMVQLLHARALLLGDVALRLDGPAPAWSALNGVATETGWASIYPPLHTAWLAVWLSFGAAWLAGPTATALTVGLTAACADALLEDRRVARVAAVLLSFAPFVLLLGATHLSHGTAAALVAASLLFCILARDRGWMWAVAAGAAVGAAVCTRPWTALVLCTVIAAGVWGPAARRRGRGWLVPRLGGLVLGGAPFAALIFWWNTKLFGHPLRLGYSVAFGPAHGLGFHRDPWGNEYGLVEALAYTGADLAQLGAHLFETPFPALAVVGAGLALQRGIGQGLRGGGVFLAWGLAGVAANALYWHHGVHMGPRLLYETAPAWVVLSVLMAVELVRRDGVLPARARSAGIWTVALALAAAAVLAPGVARAHRMETGVTLPPAPSRGPTLVFVHGSWASRVANRLAATGMRRDSIESLRQNDICAVDRYARARQGGEGTPLALSLDPRPGTPPHLRGRMLSPGNVVRVDTALSWDGGCLREARADRLGTVELEPLAWRTSPGTGSLMLVRDLGPSQNAEVLKAYPQRQPFFWISGSDDGEPRLLTYKEGVELLWGGAAGLSEASGGP